MWVLTDNGWVMRKFLSRPGARAGRLTKEAKSAAANQLTVNVAATGGPAEADMAPMPLGESDGNEKNNSNAVNYSDSDSDSGGVEVPIGTFGLLEQRCGLVDSLAGSDVGSGMAMSLEVDAPQNVMAGWEVDGEEGGEDGYATSGGGLSPVRGATETDGSGMASLNSTNGASTVSTTAAAATPAPTGVFITPRVTSAVVVAATSDPAPLDVPNPKPNARRSSKSSSSENDESSQSDSVSERWADEPCDVSTSPPLFSASSIPSPISPRPARSLLAWTAADEPRVEPFRRLKINLDLDVWRAKRLFRRGKRAEAQRLMEKGRGLMGRGGGGLR